MSMLGMNTNINEFNPPDSPLPRWVPPQRDPEEPIWEPILIESEEIGLIRSNSDPDIRLE